MDRDEDPPATEEGFAPADGSPVPLKAPGDHLERLQAANLRWIGLFSAATMAAFGAASCVQGFAVLQWQYFSIAAVSGCFVVLALWAVGLRNRGGRLTGPALFFGATYVAFVASSLLVNDRNLLFSGKILVVLNLLGVILTVPPRHLGRACIFCLIGGLILAAIELLRPPAGQFNDSWLLVLFAGALIALVLTMSAVIAYQFRQYPLATKLIAVLLLVALIPTVAQGYFDSRFLQRELATAASERLQRAAVDTARAFDALIAERSKFSRIAAKFPAFLEGVYPEAVPAPQRQGIDHIRDILHIVAGEPGREDHSYSLVDLTGMRVASTRPDYESTRVHFDAAALAEPAADEFVTPLHFDEAGPAAGVVEIFTAIRDGEGVLRGYLAVGLDGSVFQRLARDHDGLAGPMSYAIAIDDAGVRVADASSDTNLFVPVAPLTGADIARLKRERRLPEDADDDPAAPPGLETILAHEGDEPNAGFRRRSPEVGSVIGAHARLESLPWRVVFLQPQFALYAPLGRESTLHILATMLIGLAAVAIAIAVAHSLSRPIVRLADATELIRQGDLDVRLPESSRDETGRLAAAFNAMARRIRETMQGLEERIVELRESNAARQRSEDALRKLFENAPIGMVIADRDSRVIGINRAGCELLGYEPGELIGKDSRIFAHPDDYALGIEAGQRLMQGLQDTVYYEKRYIRKDGAIVYALVALTRVADSGGAHFIAQMIDLTERTQAAQQLADSEARYRLISENSSDIIALQSPDGTVHFVSPAAERILGWASSEIVGKSFQTFIHPSDLPENTAEPYKSISADDAGMFVFRARHKDGGYRWLETNARVVADPATGRVREVVTVSRDISDRIAADRERRELEAQMQHSQKLESLGILAGGIAHDFNNLLVGIMGHAGLALMDPGDKEAVREYLQNIETAALRASELTKQLLAYSGKGRFVIETLDLGRIVREMVFLLEVSTTKYAQVRFQFTEGIPAVEGDPSQIGQVAMNLITNASDAIGERQGHIDVRTGSEYLSDDDLAAMQFAGAEGPGRFVWLEVADDGQGMAPETVERIFDPFFTTKFTGRGLGLAAVIGIVRGHRGAMRVQSAPGKGTTFRVYFPASDKPLPAAEADETVAAAPAPPARKRTILVIDDEAMVRDTARRTLERAGYDVITAIDGVDGVETFGRHNGAVDAVLLDMTMPRMDGEQCFLALRRANPAIRVIISSGYDEQDTARRFRDHPPDGFIQKPYHPKSLMALLESTIARDGDRG